MNISATFHGSKHIRNATLNKEASLRYKDIYIYIYIYISIEGFCFLW